MKRYGQFLKELPSRKLVIVAADFQPITKNHEKMLAVLAKVAESRDSNNLVLVTSKNKIDAASYLQKLFPNLNFMTPSEFIGSASISAVINKILKDTTYKHVVFITSAQREKEYAKIKSKLSSFPMVEIIKATSEDPDSSAESKAMISAAKKGDFEAFRRLAPSLMIELEIKRMFNTLRQSFGAEAIKEHIKFDVSEIREKYFNEEIFKLDDIVECVNSGEVYKIVKRGSNHILVQSQDGALISKWLQDVVESTKEFTLKTELEEQMKFNQTDKLKVAKIIATSLGISDTSDASNPELLVNTALRRLKSKPMKPEYVQVVHNMLKVAKDVGIAYDEKLVPGKVEEAKEPDNTPETDEVATDIEGHEFTKVGHTLDSDDTKRKMKVKYKLGEEKDEEEELSDSDMDSMISGLSDDDYLDAYDDDELHMVDVETGESVGSLKEEVIMEVLSRQERIKAKIRFARSEAKRERKIQIALRTRSSTNTINKRARRLAIAMMKKRLAKRPLEKLTVGEKERIERIVERRKPIINRLAMKLVGKIRKVENDRLSHKTFTK